MSTLTVIDGDRVTLWYHPEHRIVHHQFRKYMYGEHFRAVLDRGIELMQEHGANKWLSDDRGNSTLSTEDGEWAMQDWTPRAVAAGWQYWAIVLPERAVGQIDMRKYMTRGEALGIQVQVFTDPILALAWLESVD